MHRTFIKENINLKSPEQNPMLKWYALYTKPRAEKKVFTELTIRNFEVYLPLQKTLKQWSDRKKKVEIPLFSSYIFIKTDPEKNYYTILEIPGIVKFVKIGKELIPIREEQIEQIKLLLSNFDDIEVSNEVIELNENVEIITGPLAGLRGKAVENQGNKTFAIELEQIGCILRVNVPKHFLKKIT